MEHTNKTNIKDEIFQARTNVTELLFEIDNITLQENPQIQAEYATKIGYLENDLLKWQIEARRAKRRLSLAQARINSGATFSTDEFEEQLNEELANWENKLNQSMKKFLEIAERANGTHALSPMETRELKKLHRMLIKRLHLDLHPTQNEEALRFFNVAQGAYKNGDLGLLRSIAVASEGLVEEDPVLDMNEDEASIELELVLAHEALIKEQLETLKRSNPYALKEKLEDGAWVIERTTQLKGQIEGQKEAAKAYDERFSELAKGNRNEQ